MKRIKSKKKHSFLFKRNKTEHKRMKNKDMHINQRELGVFYLTNISLKKHCEIYDLEPTEDACENCGNIVKTNMPFFTKDYVGLKCKPCIKCGNQVALSISKPFSKEAKQLWKKVEFFLNINAKNKSPKKEF